jgi:hypothetical protein
MIKKVENALISLMSISGLTAFIYLQIYCQRGIVQIFKTIVQIHTNYVLKHGIRK